MKPIIIPNKEELVFLLKTKSKRGLDKLLKTTIKNTLKREINLKKIHVFFSYVYDKMYHDLLEKKIIIPRSTLQSLELLATPMYLQHNFQQKFFIKKIIQKLG